MKILKKLFYKAQLWDGIWSVPLAAVAFTLVGVLLGKIFGQGVGFYDPSFLQAAFLAAFILVVFNTVSWLGFYFNFRHLFKYYLTTAKNDFDNLRGWQKLSLVLFLYVFYIAVLLILTNLFL